MGSLYRLGQKFVDFCNVVQQNIRSEVTVPSSKVLYDETNEIMDALTIKSGDVIYQNASFYGIANSGGNGLYCYCALPTADFSNSHTVHFTNFSINWIRKEGTSITGTAPTTGLIIGNQLGFNISGTFTPLGIYACAVVFTAVVD